MRKNKGFTLVEILIVVVLLGLIAAIVIPLAANSTTRAKNSALACSAQMIRRYILVYRSQHLEIAPGYPDGDTSQAPTEQAFIDQITKSSKTSGETAAIGTAGFEYGPYLMRMPTNPFNNKATIQMLGNGDAFPAAGDNSHGWVYKASTFEIRPDNSGSDLDGKPYYEY